jgi:hypothetical protein
MKSLLAVTGLSRTMAIVVVSVAVLGGATGIYVTTSSGKAPTSVTDVDGERPAGADSVTSPSADEVEKAAAAAAAAEAARVQAEADAAAVAAEVAQALSDTTAGRPAASGQQQAPAAAPPVQQEGGGTVVRCGRPRSRLHQRDSGGGRSAPDRAPGPDQPAGLPARHARLLIPARPGPSTVGLSRG